MFLERARVAAELAERSWRPADPLPVGDGVATACELYRQSIHWALLAHHDFGREGGAPISSLPRLWDEADPALLARAADGTERLARLRAELVEKSFVDFAELPRRRGVELAERARAFSRVLVEALEPERKQAERRWFRRALFAACGVFVVVAVVLVARAVRSALEARRDLAARASWTVSSSYGVGGCTSPLQDCPESPNYFFHTNQENDPWLVVDLGRVRETSSVVVLNRLDGYADRAVPLVVELSTDRKSWTFVAQNNGTFHAWRANYPKTRARYVKLHVAKPNAIFHLKSVRVLP